MASHKEEPNASSFFGESASDDPFSQLEQPQPASAAPEAKSDKQEKQPDASNKVVGDASTLFGNNTSDNADPFFSSNSATSQSANPPLASNASAASFFDQPQQATGSFFDSLGQNPATNLTQPYNHDQQQAVDTNSSLTQAYDPNAYSAYDYNQQQTAEGEQQQYDQSQWIQFDPNQHYYYDEQGQVHYYDPNTNQEYDMSQYGYDQQGQTYDYQYDPQYADYYAQQGYDPNAYAATSTDTGNTGAVDNQQQAYASTQTNYDPNTYASATLTSQPPLSATDTTVTANQSYYNPSDYNAQPQESQQPSYQSYDPTANAVAEVPAQIQSEQTIDTQHYLSEQQGQYGMQSYAPTDASTDVNQQQQQDYGYQTYDPNATATTATTTATATANDLQYDQSAFASTNYGVDNGSYTQIQTEFEAEDLQQYQAPPTSRDIAPPPTAPPKNVAPPPKQATSLPSQLNQAATPPPPPKSASFSTPAATESNLLQESAFDTDIPEIEEKPKEPEEDLNDLDDLVLGGSTSQHEDILDKQDIFAVAPVEEPVRKTDDIQSITSTVEDDQKVPTSTLQPEHDVFSSELGKDEEKESERDVKEEPAEAEQPSTETEQPSITSVVEKITAVVLKDEPSKEADEPAEPNQTSETASTEPEETRAITSDAADKSEQQSQQDAVVQEEQHLVDSEPQQEAAHTLRKTATNESQPATDHDIHQDTSSEHQQTEAHEPEQTTGHESQQAYSYEMDPNANYDSHYGNGNENEGGQLTGYEPQQASGHEPQQFNSYEKQQTTDYEHQQFNSYEPQQFNSYEPQQATVYESQQATGYEPQQTTGYEPQQATGYESQHFNSYEPQQATGYESQQFSSYEPQQATGYESQQATGYEPQQTTGYEPQQSTGYEPQQSTGYEPQQSTGYEPISFNSYEPQENTSQDAHAVPSMDTQYQYGGYEPQQSNELATSAIPALASAASSFAPPLSSSQAVPRSATSPFGAPPRAGSIKSVSSPPPNHSYPQRANSITEPDRRHHSGSPFAGYYGNPAVIERSATVPPPITERIASPRPQLIPCPDPTCEGENKPKAKFCCECGRPLAGISRSTTPSATLSPSAYGIEGFNPMSANFGVPVEQHVQRTPLDDKKDAMVTSLKQFVDSSIVIQSDLDDEEKRKRALSYIDNRLNGLEESDSKGLLWRAVKLMLEHTGNELDNALAGLIYTEEQSFGSENTDKIEELLSQGKRDEACQFAAEKDMWAHALVMASSAEGDLFKQTVSKFINRELFSSGTELVPQVTSDKKALRMLYSVFNGAGADAVSEYVKKTVDDEPVYTEESLAGWEYILSLILKNRSTNDQASMRGLGDQLKQLGKESEARLCYLLSPDVSGLDNSIVGSSMYTDLDALYLTEFYEFATKAKLQQDFKLVLAWWLAELGFADESEKYTNAIVSSIDKDTLESLKQVGNVPSDSENVTSLLERQKFDGLIGSIEEKLSQADHSEQPQQDVHNNGYDYGFGYTAPTDATVPTVAAVTSPFGKPKGIQSPFANNGIHSPFISQQESYAPSPYDSTNNNIDNNGTDSWWGADATNQGNQEPYQPYEATTADTSSYQPYEPTSTGNNSYQPDAYTPVPTTTDASKPSWSTNDVADDDDDLGFGNTKPKKVSAAESTKDDTVAEKSEEKPKESEKKEKEHHEKSGGWGIFSLFGRKEKEANHDEKKAVKANLGEQSSFYYDEKEKRWVNKLNDTPAAAAPPPPPPKASTPQPPTATPMAPPLAGLKPNSMPPARTSSAPNVPAIPGPGAPPGAAPPVFNTPPASRRAAGARKPMRSRYVDVLNQN